MAEPERPQPPEATIAAILIHIVGIVLMIVWNAWIGVTVMLVDVVALGLLALRDSHRAQRSDAQKHSDAVS